MTEQRNERAANAAFTADNTLLLIMKFAAPAILALLVNSIYSMVDQVMIGHGVGFDGNAAVNVIYPVIVLNVALAALVGDGAAVYFSLHLGKGQTEQASRCVVTSMAMTCALGLAFLGVGQLAAAPLAGFLGATEVLLPMTLPYLRITLLGVPFVILSTVLSGQIRADGSPRYAMVSTLSGCVINVLLDPLFIFFFGWGVAGAAWATVIGQAANCILALSYLPRFQTIPLSLHPRRIRRDVALETLRLGLAGFVNQLAGAIYMLVMNRYLAVYGSLSAYGAEIPLAVFGIVMKLNQLALSVINGVAVGLQPIIGYHYGRGDFGRVKTCLKVGIAVSTVCGLLAFALFQLFPGRIMGIFGQGDAAYLSFASLCLRVFLFCVPIYGFSAVATGLFQAIGKPVQSTCMALSRQVIFLIPLVMILAPLRGVEGILFASPIGDVFAFATCLLLYIREQRKFPGYRERAKIIF